MRLLYPKILPYTERPFIVGPCNELAYKWLTEGDSFATYLVGPFRSGKKHLADLWATRFGAQTYSLEKALSLGDLSLIVALDVPALPQEHLFHLFNALKEKNGRILFTSSKHPKELGLSLKDLESRLLSCHIINIDPPDTETLKKLYHELFHIHGILVAEEVIDFLLLRLDRSYATVQSAVETLESQSLNRAITIPFVKECLGI